MTELKIYVACLAAYDNGILHGKWIDASSDVSEMEEEINQMLKESPSEDAEEWAIHDYEGFTSLSEYSSLATVSEHVGMVEIAEDANIPYEVVSEFSSSFELSELQDRYSGGWADLSDWAYELAIDTGMIDNKDSPLISYVDWDRVASDWSMDYFTIEHDGTTYLFYNH